MDAGCDDTEWLCEGTAELLRSFQMQYKSRHGQQPRDPAPSCPCGRDECQTKVSTQVSDPGTPLQLQDMQPIVCTNVSNTMGPSNMSQVVTSPNEIYLTVRFDSWLNENGVLVLKPSIHRASSVPDPACLSLAANSNTSAMLRPAQAQAVSGSDSVEEADGDDCEGEDAPESCARNDDGNMMNLLLQLQQLQQQQQRQQKQQDQQQAERQAAEQHVVLHNSGQQSKPKRSQGGGSGRDPNQQPSQQRTKQSPPQPQPPPSSTGHRHERAVQAQSGVVGHRRGHSARGQRRTPDSAEATALIRQLYQVLDAKLKHQTNAE